MECTHLFTMKMAVQIPKTTMLCHLYCSRTLFKSLKIKQTMTKLTNNTWVDNFIMIRKMPKNVLLLPTYTVIHYFTAFFHKYVLCIRLSAWTGLFIFNSRTKKYSPGKTQFPCYCSLPRERKRQKKEEKPLDFMTI